MRLLGSKIVLSWFKDGAKIQVHQPSVVSRYYLYCIVPKARPTSANNSRTRVDREASSVSPQVCVTPSRRTKASSLYLKCRTARILSGSSGTVPILDSEVISLLFLFREKESALITGRTLILLCESYQTAIPTFSLNVLPVPCLVI